MDGRSASSASVSYDPARDTAVPHRLDIDGHLAALERFTKLEQALPRTHPTATPPLSSLGELAIEGAEAWLAQVALAKERGLRHCPTRPACRGYKGAERAGSRRPRLR